MQLQYHLKENVSSKHARAESIVNYWKSTSDEEAKAMLDNQLLSMLFHGEKSTSSNVYFLKVSDM
ncbi:hypothetical protein AT251_11910 [Enterovibrio nigricans]|nr:hypothetical protein [Enterovibrio nigricans]PKF50406.1 hypothetical protein AT251_11910 [Enterovibrio nigricans]